MTAFFQLITFGSWIFSLVLNIPGFLVRKVRGNVCMLVWPEEWMNTAYGWMWFVLVVFSVALMAGLYTRVVYNLWFKRNDGNKLIYQQRVSDEQEHVLCSFIQSTNIFLILLHQSTDLQ